MTVNESGSIWRKWDLHVHSPMSILNNQFPKTDDGMPDWETYVTKLEQVTASVVGITDYFTIEGYKKIREYRNQGRLTNLDLVLPNIEFRLNEILYRNPDGKGPKRLNLHVIFSDEISPDVIEDHFLHNLYFESRGNVEGKPFKERLKSSTLEDLGRILKSQLSQEYAGKSPAIVGAENATVSLEDIKHELELSDRFRDKYLVVLDEENTSLIEWGKQDTQTRLTLLQNSHMVFSSNRKTRSWSLGRAPFSDGEDEFVKIFGSLKPCIHGSDAHKLEEIGRPCVNRHVPGHNCADMPDECVLRHCWFKADPTFEGLKQTVYEPDERVFIGEEDPTTSRYNYTLSQVTLSETVINRELTVQYTDLTLSRYLVAVTGGRGTGKTALVDLIANCFSNAVEKQNDDSFVVRISHDSPELESTIRFTGAEPFSKYVMESDVLISEADLAYISQGQLDDYITDNNELIKRIRELIFDESSQVLTYEFHQLLARAQEVEVELMELSSEIIAMEKDTSDELLQELDNRKNRLNVLLKDLGRQLDVIRDSDADENEIKKAQDAQRNLAELRLMHETLEKLKIHLLDALAFLDNDIPRFNAAIEAIETLVGFVDYDGDQSPTLEYDRENLENLARYVERSITDTLAQIDAIQDELKARDEKVARHASLLDQQSEGEKDLKALRETLEGITTIKSDLATTLGERKALVIEMLQLVRDLQTKYLEIIGRFKRNAIEHSDAPGASDHGVLRDLEFQAEIHFDRNGFLEEADDLFDSRSITVASYFSDTLEEFSKFARRPDDDSVDTLAESIESHSNDPDLRTKMKPNKSINLDDYFKVFYRNYFNVSPTVKYKNTPLDRLSLGQKATVLFKIYLAHGDYPVIIDSHDDYLDNEFIMLELIPAIREAKKRRQVILVSNNANVVVNSDAEQVIVAEFSDGKISYNAGALENRSTRKRIINVLEGGRKAFKLRQDKYRLSSP